MLNSLINYVKVASRPCFFKTFKNVNVPKSMCVYHVCVCHVCVCHVCRSPQS